MIFSNYIKLYHICITVEPVRHTKGPGKCVDCTGCQNLSNPTHQGTREVCRIVQDVRTSLIRHTKGPGKCVELYRMSKYSGFILVNRNTLGSYIFVGKTQVSDCTSSTVRSFRKSYGLDMGTTTRTNLNIPV
jgi:hypothetical protein